MPGWNKDHENTRQAFAECTALKRAREAEVLAKVEKYAKEGLANLVISQRLGISRNKVEEIRKQLGLQSRRGPLCFLPNGTP
jgi:hypothetical protein